MMIPKSLIEAASKIVIKIGSALLVDEAGAVRKPWLCALAEDIVALRAKGKAVVIVTSGAIGLGRGAMGIDRLAPSSSIPLDRKQAAASVGQIALMQSYIEALAPYDVRVAQILLTRSDTENRRSHLNARATFQALLERGVLPIVNENDTVSTTEIRFGDNDRLASRVAQMIGSDLVIQLSTTDGLYTADPRVDSSAQHIPFVEKLGAAEFGMAGDALPGVSTGGMKSKLEAARIATEAGVSMMIAKGTNAHALSSLISDEGARATIFRASDKPLSARKKWILAHVKPAGSVFVDDGAARALKEGKSLLPAGVVRAEGTFGRGDALTLICLSSGESIGIGLCAYDHHDLTLLCGHKSEDISNLLGYSHGEEVIHRDDLVLS